MNSEHRFVHSRGTGPSASTAVESPDGSPSQGKDPTIAAALSLLGEARVSAMPQQDADQTLRELSRIQSIAASLMCDVTDMVAATNTKSGHVAGVHSQHSREVGHTVGRLHAYEGSHRGQAWGREGSGAYMAALKPDIELVIQVAHLSMHTDLMAGTQASGLPAAA